LYRKSNHSLDRYRKSESEIIETALSLVESGVHLIDLTMGEDPFYFNKGFDPLISVVERIKSATKVRIMLSAGVLCEEVLKKFRDSGVDWYATYQETHNPKLYQNLRLGQSYDERMERKLLAHKMGYLIEEGILTGVGDSNEDLVNSLEQMKLIDVDQLRVMSFIPQKETPMQSFPKVPRLKELLLIAVMRLVFPDRLIPASLDVDGLKGLSDRLNSGANVVTSIIPPRSGLAGVSNHSLDIDDGNRTIERVLPVLDQSGLLLASRNEYDEWVQLRQ
jgi:methylornithine synthase